MKKHVLIATGLAVLSTSAWATKARMEALGQDGSRGSFFIDDSRNIFRNAAQVNSMKNYVVTEWGTDATGDSAAAPQAEGGLFREAGAFAWGLYMGSTIDHQNSTRTGTAIQGATVGEANFLNRDNQLDLFIGGDAGVEWGARVSYAKASDKNTGGRTFERTSSALGVGLGVVAGDLGAWANLDLSDESKGASTSGDKWEADLGLHLGATYDVAGMTVFAEYDKTGAEYANEGGTFKPTIEESEISLGVAKVQEQSSTSRYFYSIQYNNEKAEGKATATTSQETTTTSLPVTIGFEADATSWLTLRGSVSHTLPFLNKEETKPNTGTATEQTSSNTTDVAAGATLNFGKLKVDGTVGTFNATNGAGETGIVHLDNLMARVGVHYWF